METREFTRGFRDFTPEEQRSHSSAEHHINPEIEELLDDARFWGEYFSDLTVRGLESRIDDPEKANAELSAYLIWNVHNFSAITKKVRAAVRRDAKNGIYLNELNFHALAIAAEEEWRILIDPTYHRSNHAIEIEQLNTAVTAAGYVQDRRMIGSPSDPGEQQLIKSINGQITELDTMLVLLQIVKENDNGRFLAIPSPPLFESGRYHKASDMLFIDREAGHTRGIQAKTRITNAPIYKDSKKTVYDRYDARYVTLIDGVHDLGNSNTKKIPGQSNMVAISSPGLLSLDLLTSTPLRDLPGYVFPLLRPRLIRAKGIADELSRTRNNFMPQATKNVAAKLSNDLYK